MANSRHGLAVAPATASETSDTFAASEHLAAHGASRTPAPSSPAPTRDPVAADKDAAPVPGSSDATSGEPEAPTAAAVAHEGAKGKRATVAHSAEVSERTGKKANARSAAIAPGPSGDYLAEMATAAAEEQASGENTASAPASTVDHEGVRTKLSKICRELASQLTALARAELLAEGYTCHKALYQGQKASITSFAKRILDEAKIDKRTVQNDVMIATRLSQETRDALRHTGVAGSTRTLIRIAGFGGDDEPARELAQAALVAALRHGMGAFNAEMKTLCARRGTSATNATEVAKLVVNLAKRAVDEGLELTVLLDQVRAAWDEVAS